MSNRWRCVGLALAVAAGICLWRVLNPSPEAVIRGKFASLARTASFTPNDGSLVKLAKAEKAAWYFAPRVEVVVDAPGHIHHEFGTREEIEDAGRAFSIAATGFSVKFPDVNVTINGDGQSALADVTLEGQIDGQHDDIIEELEVTLIKIDDNWLISRMQTVRTLSHP